MHGLLACGQVVGNFGPFHNACVLFRAGASRRMQTQFVSLSGLTAIIHGFSEYRYGFIRLATVRTPLSSAEAALLRNTCTWQRGPGLAVPFTANNVYHALFHAVPAFEGLASSANQSAAAFVPLFSLSAGVGRKLAADVTAQWHAWEFLLRALTADSTATIAAALDAMLHRPCTCFSRVYGATGPFSPSAPSSVPRLLRWRRALLKNAHESNAPARIDLRDSSPFNSTHRILYARRTSSR